MRGDCSIRIDGIGFTAEEIAACAAKQGLLSIEVELSAAEQCECTNCVSQKSPQAVLSPSEISGLIDQAQALGTRRVILIDSVTGAYRHLREIIESLYEKKLEVELFVGDSEITSDFARFLFDRRVKVSVDCIPPSPGTPGEGRGEGDFERQAALASQNHPHPGPLPVYRERGPERAVIDCLKDAGYGSSDAPALAVRIAVTADNLEQIPTRWRWARNNNFDPHIQIIKPANGLDPSQILAPDRARQLYEQLGEIDRLEFNRIWDKPPSLIGRSCKRHLFAVHLAACGTVYACVGVTIPLGTIRTESLGEIISLSEVLEDIRAFDLKVKEPCRTCSQTVDCYGCRGAAYQLTGDYLAGDQMCWKADGIAIESLPVDVGRLIPHGPSIRMVDQLVQIGERRASTIFTVRYDSQWIDEQGRLDDLAYIEIIAQSFAAIHGFHLTLEELTKHKGMLLGVTNLAISGQARAGDNLKIEIRKMTRFGDFGIVEGEVRHQDSRLIAVGQVKVWRPSSDTARAMMGS